MSGTEGETSERLEADTEPELSHPDFEYANKRYHHKATGKFASKADVEKAIEASKAAAAKAQSKMAEHHKIRLPTWNPAKPKLWFKECDNMFELAKVDKDDQRTKAILVAKELPAAVKNTIEQQSSSLMPLQSTMT